MCTNRLGVWIDQSHAVLCQLTIVQYKGCVSVWVVLKFFQCSDSFLLNSSFSAQSPLEHWLVVVVSYVV